MCQNHGKLVDSDASHFTVRKLREWKQEAERRAFQAIVATSAQREEQVAAATIDAAVQLLIDHLGLPADDTVESVVARMMMAARRDLASFQRTVGWPQRPVALNLRMTSANERAFQADGLAAALDAFNEISVVAQPGTGKTTTLLQVADEILKMGRLVPLFLPLGEWAAQTGSLLQVVLHRSAYQDVREQHLIFLGHHGRLILLLDGWNELDRDARRRATAEIKRLRRDFPAVGIVISTRRQALDVPIAGPVVEIDNLTEDQQREIARTLQGTQGEALLDRALRTPGVRTLIAIPLYLTALLAHAPEGNMPTTKEAVLRLFIREHERDADRAEALRGMLFGFHGEILTALALEATRTASTAISDTRARAVVKQTEDRLAAEGQISETPQPTDVLDLFVNHHILVRSGAPVAALSFQHQQFQEWYASFEVERAMRAAASGEIGAIHHLRADIVDKPAWEEPILFASERASRTDQAGVQAVAMAIEVTLAIDPMLAAEMIYCADSAVWDRVRDAVLAFIGRWHRTESLDRAVGFMIASGRPEFAEQIWTLLENPDTQVHLAAMRAARRFRPSVLDSGSEARLARLPQMVRQNLLAELVMRGAPEAIQLAVSVAKSDASVDVQFGVVETLLFRRADRQAAELLSVAVPQIWTMLAAKGYGDEIADRDARDRVNRERQRMLENDTNPARRIGLLLASASLSDTDKPALATAIESAGFPPHDQNISWQIQRAFERYPDVVAAALMRRLESGRDLPYRASDMLTSISIVDDGPIAAMVTNLAVENQRAIVAASVIGPRTVETLIDTLMRLADQIASTPGRYDRAVNDQYRALRDRIVATRPTPFCSALLTRGDTDQPHRIGVFADLLASHGRSDSNRKSFVIEEGNRPALIGLVHRWAETLLTAPTSKRQQMAEVARAIGRLSAAELVPDLARLLVADLLPWRVAREMRRTSIATMSIEERSDAAHRWTLQYRQAFAAIGGDRVVEIMRQYLENEDFGLDAGWVLKEIWDGQQNIPASNMPKYQLRTCPRAGLILAMSARGAHNEPQLGGRSQRRRLRR